MFWTAVHCFFSRVVTRIYEWFELSRVKLYWNDDLKGNQYYFELVGDSNYEGFELLGVGCVCLFCQFYTPVTAATMSCIFMPLSRYYMSSFWPKFLLSPGLILWLKRSYAPGFVISSCCFRRLLNWAKFWYRSVLNCPHIKRTPFIKRTNSPAENVLKWNWLQSRLIG